MKGSKGFTLIELIVVISIIGLLSSIVFASLKTARDKGRIAAGQEFNAHNYHVLAGDSPYLLLNFDEALAGDGSTLPLDQSGNSPVITFGGSGTARSSDIPGKRGVSMSFNGSGSIDAANVKVGSSATVTFWIKSSDYSSTIPISWAADNSTVGLGIYFTGNQILLRDQPNNHPALFNSYPDDQWHHFALSMSPSTGAKLYLDGKLVGKSTYSDPTMATGLFRMGSWSYNGSQGLHGLMDEVYVYSQALAQSDIESIYASGVSRHLANK